MSEHLPATAKERARIVTRAAVIERIEARLAANGYLRPVDVLEVPHHGSKSSSTPALVEATKPRFAIISVGQHSMFGHPHREVVERWEASGAQVLTTGRSGTITVTTDGTTLSVQPQRSTKSHEK